MAIQVENRGLRVEHEENGRDGNGAAQPPPLPPLGNSIRIVGEVESVDYRQTPHPKNSRGELGVPMYNWYTNSISHDPLGRIASDRHAADNRNVVNAVVAKAPKGGVNPRQTAIRDAKVM